MSSFIFEGHEIECGNGITIDEEYTDYGSLLDTLHPNINWKYVMTDSYQGDWFAVGYYNEEYFYHNGSYGSCSYCDWLESICDEKGAIELLKEMKKIIPTGNWESTITYLKREMKNTWTENVDALMELQEWVRSLEIELRRL